VHILATSVPTYILLYDVLKNQDIIFLFALFKKLRFAISRKTFQSCFYAQVLVVKIFDEISPTLGRFRSSASQSSHQNQKGNFEAPSVFLV
jgi:hypothetical protein